MNTQLQTRKKATATPLSSFTSVPSGLIQRKCACGGTPGVDDECAECRAKRLSLQRKSDGQSPTPNNASMLPVAGHNFSHVQIHTTISEHIQPKLTVNQPGDIYEQEADRSTEQVMRMPEPEMKDEPHKNGSVVNEKAKEIALFREAASPASKQSYDACFDGNTVFVNKGGKSQTCPALTDAGSGASPQGLYCIRRQGEAQIAGGIIGRIWQNRSKWYLLEPQFETTRFRMHLHPGSHSAGCVTVTDSKCFDKLADILNSPGTVTAEGFDGYPPGNKAGKGGSEVVNPKHSITCIGWLRVTSSGGCTSTGKQTQPASQPTPESVQRSAINSSVIRNAPPIVYEVINSPGQPLDTATRSFMESRFGHDFSNVRIHTDDRSVGSAHAVNALAYTVGRDVVFGAGQYAPGTRSGQKLLAHELTHVVQQGSVGSQRGSIQRKSPKQSSDKKKTTKAVSEEEQAQKAEKISGLINDIYDIVEETMVIQPDMKNELVFKANWGKIESQVVDQKGNLFPELSEKAMATRLHELDRKERLQVSRGVFQRLVESSSTSTNIDYHKEYTTALSERMRRNIEGGEAGFITAHSALLNTFGTFTAANLYYTTLVEADFPPNSKTKGSDTLVHPLLRERLARAADLLKKKKILESVSESIGKIGGFNIRENRNRKKTKSNLVNLSKHSFGWAIDIDENYNPNIPQSEFPRTLVRGLTGQDVYTGEAAKTIREGGSYDELLQSTRDLKTASDVFKAAFETEEALGTALIHYLNKHGATLATDKGKSLLDLIKKVPANLRNEARSKLNAKPKKKQDKQKEKEPKQPEAYLNLTAWISNTGVKEEDIVPVTSFMLEAYRLLLESHYQQDTKAHKKGEKIEASAIGQAKHIAAYGFINLRPELITALVSSDGGGLSWLGAVEIDTKDFMHFELRSTPPLPKVGDYPTPAEGQKPV